LAIEHYLQLQEKLKLEKAIELMLDEYKNDNTLTEFTLLDGEVFV